MKEARRPTKAMTCIAAAIDSDGSVHIGADAVSLKGAGVRLHRQPKVFRVGGFLIGVAGSHRTLQVVQYLFQPPKIESDLTAYMVNAFATKLRASMSQRGGEASDHDSGNQIMDGSCLIGAKGRIFEIDCAYAVLEPKSGYHAIGCADQEALSAMFAVSKLAPNTPANEKVNLGLLAAAEFDVNIRPPFTILKLDG